jgi:hypothetical protein
MLPYQRDQNLETFTSPKEFVENPRYLHELQEALRRIDFRDIDPPIVRLVKSFASLPYCFTLQCCCGHFLYGTMRELHNLERLPDKVEGPITYRIAYLAFCLENSPSGRALKESLSLLPELDPEYVQFGSADWFWEQHLNSYVIQVEPQRFKFSDQAVVDHSEALHIEQIRDRFFFKLNELMERLIME